MLTTATWRGAHVVTYLAPSRRVLGHTGVFLKTPMKKFVPMEILPTASSSPSSSVVRAPPFLCNMVRAPRHRVSLRLFSALRHKFSTDRYFHIATLNGWYLLAPAEGVALPDALGLEAWCGRHHHHYLSWPTETTQGNAKGKKRPGANTIAAAAQEARRRHHAELSIYEAQLERGELTKEETQALALEIARERTALEDEEPTSDACDDVDVVQRDATEVADDRAARDESMPTLSSIGPGVLTREPSYIAERHLFELNDGVEWPLPPADDLANHDYWAGHRERMTVYESFGDTSADEHDAYIQETMKGVRNLSPPPSSERELLSAAEALFSSFTHKANVRLEVDDERGLVTLVPLMDLPEGAELLLHYGREWWTERLLSRLFLAVDDDQMKGIRWIEGLCSAPNDYAEPFPVLHPAIPMRRRRGKGSKKPNGTGARTGASTAPRHLAQAPVLYNAASHAVASDAAALVFAVRRSCQDRSFLSLLLSGAPDAGVPAVFDLQRCDVEVPIERLRCALLHSLRVAKHNSGGIATSTTTNVVNSPNKSRLTERSNMEDDEEASFLV